MASPFSVSHLPLAGSSVWLLPISSGPRWVRPSANRQCIKRASVFQSRSPFRYHQNERGSSFDSLRWGFLGTETHMKGVLAIHERWHWRGEFYVVSAFCLSDVSKNLQLLCSSKLLMWIAVEFEWKLQGIEAFDGIVNINSIDDIRQNHSRLVSQFRIEMTLAGRCFSRM